MRGEGRTLLPAARTGFVCVEGHRNLLWGGEEARERSLFYWRDRRDNERFPGFPGRTGNSYTGLKGKYLEAGFSDYLSKPISFRELNKLINKFFSEK